MKISTVHFTASPRKSDSPQGNNSFFQKKSRFGFDDLIPGSPASRASTSPRYSGGRAENSFFDNFSRYDSFNATDRGSPKQETFSRFDCMSSFTHDNNFSRFDSMSSTAQDRSFARFDSMSSNAGFDHGHTYATLSTRSMLGRTVMSCTIKLNYLMKVMSC